MKRKLLRQIFNEWRSNTWLLVELLLVSVVMWYIICYLTTQTIIFNQDLGYDYTDVCQISFEAISDDSSEYNPDYKGSDAQIASFKAITERLANVPSAKVVSTSSWSLPFSQNFFGAGLSASDGIDSLSVINSGLHIVSPEYFEVLQISGANGETPEQLANLMRQGNAMLLTTDFIALTNPNAPVFKSSDSQAIWQEVMNQSNAFDKKKIIGRTFVATTDTLRPYRVAALTVPIKRYQFESPSTFCFIPMAADFFNADNLECMVRTKPGKLKEFSDYVLTKADSEFRVGNIYVSNVTSLSDMSHDVCADRMIQIRNYVTVMLFLLLCIFLGLLGTFWFRTQQRVAEIAIRKVNGATSQQVFKRFIGEGLILLTISTVPAIVIDLILCHYEQVYLLTNGNGAYEPSMIALTLAITYIVMAAIIVLGILFPAYRAMKVQPAIALKDE